MVSRTFIFQLFGVLFLVLIGASANSQTEAWPQYSRYLDRSVWFSADRPATAGMILVEGGMYSIGTDLREIREFCRQAGIPDPPSQLLDTQFAKRNVELRPFYILDHEVSNKEYLEFLDATLHAPPRIEPDTEGSWAVNQMFAWRGRSYPPGRAGFPVTGITKADAEAFCAWRTEVTGVVHRLPTEEEWEAAYRGKESNLFPWGMKWEGALRVPVRRHMHVGPDPFYASTDDRTPSGIKFLFGGVREYTSTVVTSHDKLKRGTPVEEGSTARGGETRQKLTVLRGDSYDSSLGLCPVQLRSFKTVPDNPCESNGPYRVGFRYVISK